MRKKEFLRYCMTIQCMILVIVAISIWQNNQTIRVRRLGFEKKAFEKIEIIEEWQERMTLSGMAIQRSVKVLNESEVPVFIRASFEEVLRYISPESEEQDVAIAANAENAPDLLPIISRFNEIKILQNGYQNITHQVKDLDTSNGSGTIMIWINEETIKSVVGEGVTGSYEPNSTDTRNQDDMQLGLNEETIHQPIFVDAHFGYAFKQIQVPLMQKMNGKLLLLNPHEPSSQWNFEAVDLTFSYYAESYSYLVRNWAESKLVSPFSNNEIPSGFVYLGYQGVINETPFDYSISSNGLGDAFQLPKEISFYPPLAGFYPSQSFKTLRSFVNTGSAQLSSEAIMIEFGELSDYQQIQANSWVYNPEDGWFYYTAPIDSFYQNNEGQALTHSLLDEVIICAAVADNFHYKYDLLPKVEIIQANDPKLLIEVFQLTDEKLDSATGKIYTYLRSLQTRD